MQPPDAHNVSSTEDEVEATNGRQLTETWLGHSRWAGGLAESGWRNSDDEGKPPTRNMVWKKEMLKVPNEQGKAGVLVLKAEETGEKLQADQGIQAVLIHYWEGILGSPGHSPFIGDAPWKKSLINGQSTDLIPSLGGKDAEVLDNRDVSKLFTGSLSRHHSNLVAGTREPADVKSITKDIFGLAVKNSKDPLGHPATSRATAAED